MKHYRLKLHRIWLKTWLGVELALLTGIAAVKAEVRIEGCLKLFAFPADTNTAPFRTADFVVIRKDCEWSVLLTNLVYRESGNELAVHYFTDCEITRHVTFWTREMVERMGIRNDQKAETIKLMSGRFPNRREPIEIAPWIGFCLPFEIEHGRINLIPNVFSTLAWPTNKIPCLGEFDLNSSYAQRITLWKPRVAMKAASRRNVQDVALPQPFDSGYEGLVFEVISWSNSKRYPEIFVQTVYNVPLPLAGTPPSPLQRLPAAIVLGEVSRIVEAPLVDSN